MSDYFIKKDFEFAERFFDCNGMTREIFGPLFLSKLCYQFCCFKVENVSLKYWYNKIFVVGYNSLAEREEVLIFYVQSNCYVK